MKPKQILLTVLYQGPIALFLGILCSVAYSLEFEEFVSINWPISALLAAALLAFSLGRSIRDARKSEDPGQRSPGP